MVPLNTFEGLTPEGAAGSSNPYSVQPFGFFFGILGACVLYGLHIAQIHRYTTTPNEDSRWKKIFVFWIFTLSTLQIIINWGAGAHYFVNGITNDQVWGAMHWTLSWQDALVPTMAATCQSFFGRRAWALTGRKPALKWIFSVLIPLTWVSGMIMAVLSFFWARDPFEGAHNFWHVKVGKVADSFPAVWMALSALCDGLITLVLVIHFARVKTAFRSTRMMLRRALQLTLETVFLTHLTGGVMVILFLWKRTSTNAFWILLELVTELYALSVLFTLNARPALRRSVAGTRGALRTITVSQPQSQQGTAREVGEIMVELKRDPRSMRAGAVESDEEGALEKGGDDGEDFEALTSADDGWSTVHVELE